MDSSHNLGPLSLVECLGGSLKGIECPVPLTNWWGVTNGFPLQEHSSKLLGIGFLSFLGT